MKNSVFDYKSPDYDKLVRYGFTVRGDAYSYTTELLNGQFQLRIEISAASGEVKTRLIDSATEEPYTLHLVEDAVGAFVGAIRSEYERVLSEISERCFVRDAFKSGYAHKVIGYVRERYGDELEFLWKTSPSTAVWRRKDNRKWYGILFLLSKRKLGLDSDEAVDIIDLRADPEVLSQIADGKRYFPGYHMNKKSWMSICLDGSVPIEEIYAWIDKSYRLAQKG